MIEPSITTQIGGYLLDFKDAGIIIKVTRLGNQKTNVFEFIQGTLLSSVPKSELHHSVGYTTELGTLLSSCTIKNNNLNLNKDKLNKFAEKNLPAKREEASHIEDKSEEKKKPEISSSSDKMANSSEDSSGSSDSKPKKNKEVFNSGEIETFNSGEVDFMPNEKVFSKSFIPVDLSKEAAYMANIQKIINSGGELSGNQILSVFRKKYGDAGLGSYLILKQHRVKMKAFLVDLKTCKMLQITDYYIRNYKGIHKECNISSDKPSVDILLSSYMNHFISKALNEDVKKKEIDPNNLGIPEKFRDVVTAAGSW